MYPQPAPEATHLPPQEGSSPSHSPSRANHPALSTYPEAFRATDALEQDRLLDAYDRFEDILEAARGQFPDCSDVQFVGGGNVWVHANGADHRTGLELDNETDLLAWAKVFGRGGDGDVQLIEGARGAVENAIDIAGVRLRMTFRRQMGGYGLNIRILSQEPPTLDSPRFARNPIPQALIDIIMNNQDGLVLFEGPTGSGKSTMQAALVAEINRTQQRHIYTLEDPIEFVHNSQRSLITQRQVGTDVDSFAQGLITAKRSKPGVILLGELRDKVVMRAAIESAGEGHLVLATSHASDVPSAIASFVGSFGSDEQPEIRQRLAGALRAVIVQRLVPTVDKKVVPARELLVINSTIAAKIRETSSSEKIEAAMNSSGSKGEGTFSRDEDLISLVEKGHIDTDTALRHSAQDREVRERLVRKNLLLAPGQGTPAPRR
ncbi:type IV pilus twitching motility protein PilT [Microbacterium sp.]|uniref:type IV pilus twitching motility protein PilT n=1 Tax=Microbacterium sp. TaxID=51671 RepID=UPI0025E25E6A|nr:ATPase, T2SS/T4P/T4SS family [Microbacterium sp.]